MDLIDVLGFRFFFIWTTFFFGAQHLNSIYFQIYRLLCQQYTNVLYVVFFRIKENNVVLMKYSNNKKNVGKKPSSINKCGQCNKITTIVDKQNNVGYYWPNAPDCLFYSSLSFSNGVHSTDVISQRWQRNGKKIYVFFHSAEM